jgi:hypothetical protein
VPDQPLKPAAHVFLNVPYDGEFLDLYLAYIAGISAFGLVPRATLEIPGGARRLDRIFDLIQACRYSLHDLSRVELDTSRPPTPRFNMPFELGLCLAWQRIGTGDHVWFVFEAKSHRLSKSLSDLNGTDPYIHGGRVNGVFRELCNAFVRPGLQPSVPQLRKIYRKLKENVPRILDIAGAQSVFQARVFQDLCVFASKAADEFVGGNILPLAILKRIGLKSKPQ